MRPFSTLAAGLGLGFLLAACGGGTTTGGTPAGVANPAPLPGVTRGSLVGQAASVAVNVGGNALTTLSPSVLAGFLESAQQGTLAVAGQPQCAVSVYRVHYNTVGGAGEATDASAAVFVPSGSGNSCANSRPVLLYAHGTSLQKSYDMADIANNTEARLAAAVFAAQGFIVVAPNYAGYGGSSLGYHAYLDRVQQSADMIDALRAARSSFTAIGARDSGKLVLSGYSQGGYVALATQRAMQDLGTAEFTPSAVGGMSGPYALSRFGDELFGGAPRNGATVIVPLIINAGQHASAALYNTPADVYEAPYFATIADLVPGTLGSGDLVGQGKLPATALFAADSLPQSTGYTQYFGAGNLIRSAYRAGYLADVAAHPCEQSAAAPLSCAPAHNLRKWLIRNDLRSYAPGAPTLLCGGHDDPTVPYFNTSTAGAYFRARGANVTELDIDDTPGLNDPYRTAKAGFVAAKAVLRLASGSAAVEASYHAGLVAPFCMAATRDYFQSVLSR
ncbi:prolyl oligopeptidase family serine peptidase [Massilia forsythiae]|uniref:Prolyl oligopeptidase family serine peptidase n=1 Tax=Massilia forsythiae TaxID=2728020 RepID=A0A7Z2ZSP7_9BURK|nr:prolyl oligopeptidase family serine peptidase [Massilia forsythiae]QJE00445.1 prolyl oligopeptidase family serine peptidase [Massilia forsythiae]